MTELKNLMEEQQQQATTFEDFDDDTEQQNVESEYPEQKPHEKPDRLDVDERKVKELRENKRRHNSLRKREDVYKNDRNFLGEVNQAINKTIQINNGSSESNIPYEQESSGENTKEIVSELVHIREYKNKAELEKQVFAKPREETGLKKKLFMSLIACVAVGIFLGVQANSYYNFKEGMVTSALSCCFSWLTIENMPTSTSPLNTEIFMTGFGAGAGLLAVIILFVFLNNDEKKRSRVGHEHGNSRLATSSDFKSYKNKFMER